ncbi:MAG: efflux RND transporter periplasmic adaptor subunit [Verrucomicrobiota bacterium]|nr:efflux RND transporter periplasmic adaptor subunit [Verrucomicrobiota bacterium]
MPLFILILLLVSCSHAPPPPAKEAIPVSVIRVNPQPIPADFSFVGVGESSHIVQIRARVEGYLESINYVEGSMVEQGQLLFTLDQRPFLADLEKAQGELSHQKAVLWNAEQTKNRMVPLYAQSAVSQRDLDNSIADLLVAQADVEKAQAALYQSELNLGYSSLVSPVRGLSSQAKYRPGALITPGVGEESLLTTLYVVDPIWVNFNVSDNDLLHLRKDIASGKIIVPPNKQFRIEAVLSDGTILPAEGTIDFTNPAIQQTTGTMLIRAVLPNPKLEIYPGLFVTVRVLGAIRPHAMLVPQSAVVQGASSPLLFVVENGKAMERPVKLGEWYKDFWIIDEGLTPGDIVVARGVNRLEQGTPVTIQSMIPETP